MTFLSEIFQLIQILEILIKMRGSINFNKYFPAVLKIYAKVKKIRIKEIFLSKNEI